MPRLIPRSFYSVREAVEEIGRHLFPDEWTDEEAEARALPPPSDAARLVEQRAELKRAAEEAGLKSYAPYDPINPPPRPPDWSSGAGLGMPEPDTPINRLRRRLRETERIERWPEVGSDLYERERAAFVRWTEAESQLVEGLREGHLPAFKRRTNGMRTDLSPDTFRDTRTVLDVRSSRFGPDRMLCEIPADALRKLLGSSLSAPGASSSSARFGIQTGYPGRPSMADAVLRLAEERVGCGTAAANLAAEAKELHEEIRRLYPGELNYPKPETIANQIRELHRHFRGKATK